MRRPLGLAVLMAGVAGLAATTALAQTAEPRPGAHGLTLPGSFTGTLPCADCPGIDHHLDLWPGGGYALRMAYQERDTVSEQFGRWHADPARRAIVLDGEAPMEWQVLGTGDLRLLDRDGQPIESELPYDLTAGPLDPLAIAGPMTGMFTYFADAAMFEECLTGQRVPVLMEADYLALERAYMDARSAPMAPLLTRLEGSIAMAEAMEGPDRPSLTVERLHHVTPGGDCLRSRAPAELVNSYWRVDSVDGHPLDPADGRREGYLLLLPGEEGETRFSATLGCNMMMGGYSLEGDSLGFGPVAASMMACPPPLDRLEGVFAAALEAVDSARSDGHSLQLLDADGRIRAQFTAVHTPW